MFNFEKRIYDMFINSIPVPCPFADSAWFYPMNSLSLGRRTNTGFVIVRPQVASLAGAVKSPIHVDAVLLAAMARLGALVYIWVEQQLMVS